MQTPTIAVIGAGNMGRCLISGLIKNGHPNDKIWASNINEQKLDELKTDFQIHTTTDNAKAIETADVIILAMKPQKFAEVADTLRSTIHYRVPLIISVAAGITIANIEAHLAPLPIVRTMPNVAAHIACGATALFANHHVTAEQRDIAESIMRGVGIAIWLTDEKLMDVVTALSGSGPAYFFLVMEALQTAAEELGLPKDAARLLTLETALGSARLALESDHSLAELRQHVTSRGGTTEKALSVLEENDIRGVFKEAVTAAKQRAEELNAMLAQET